jgi:hypothetical protein
MYTRIGGILQGSGILLGGFGLILSWEIPLLDPTEDDP